MYYIIWKLRFSSTSQYTASSRRSVFLHRSLCNKLARLCRLGLLPACFLTPSISTTSGIASVYYMIWKLTVSSTSQYAASSRRSAFSHRRLHNKALSPYHWGDLALLKGGPEAGCSGPESHTCTISPESSDSALRHSMLLPTGGARFHTVACITSLPYHFVSRYMIHISGRAVIMRCRASTVVIGSETS